MSHQNVTAGQIHQAESHAPYMTLFFVLLNFTAMEYLYARFFESGFFLTTTLIGAALLITILTAIVAGMYKLHFNRRWVYLTMVPAVLLSFFPVPLIFGLLILAITKATLVGLWFMHLKYEDNWVYYMLVPAGILAIILTLALYPDIAMAPIQQRQDLQEETLTQLLRPDAFPGSRLS